MNNLLKEVLSKIPEIDKKTKHKIIIDFTSLQDIIRRQDHLNQIIKKGNTIRKIVSRVIGNNAISSDEVLYQSVLDYILKMRFKNLYSDESPIFLGTSNIAQQFWCQTSVIYKSIEDEYMFKTVYERIIKEKGENLPIEEINKLIENEQQKEVDNNNSNIKIIYGNPFSLDPLIRGKADESLYAEKYPKFMYYFKYRNKIIIAAPDGITDDFCYEFKSTSSEFLLRYVQPVALAQASLYSYFFKRPKIRVQIYITATKKIKTIEEDLSTEKVEKYLNDMIDLLEGKREIILPKEWKCKNCKYKKYCFQKN
ncbi:MULTISPECIES: hypothetical protein [Thermoanaerobacterium]|uniref:RecB family exonuclease n=3 Tax=Thermoanaerobacterium TaxID=28895 RepID=L0IR52_THETR|nr:MULTISPECIES: hypothetical protein [Thermoanaerobacterium]AFK94283.1 hypothetical protein Tsac_2736 [Thermoanaerobacterium saccharolyticum JW/SL-YS485]AGB20457.1 RecB family exonuclease [Thermoanaerobacterium thermosaccharolyticum M0795]ETO39076.1 hypothetical protein V518_0783 [Thermoanaerobacterium aotearoense SCUT27]